MKETPVTAAVGSGHLGHDRLERLRRHYAAHSPGWQPATARYQAWVRACLTPEARVLDLGCGRGGVVERLAGQGRWCGADPDLASLREHRYPHLARSCAPAGRLPFSDGVFDVVACSWVLEHLPSPALTFAEIARVLRPGGHFLFLTPNARHPLPRLNRALARQVDVQRRMVPYFYARRAEDAFPVYYRANTWVQIDLLATQAGLRLVRMEFVGDPSYLAWNRGSLPLALGLELLLPSTWKVHLVGQYKRSRQ